MEIGDWRATADLNDIYREIRALGLETAAGRARGLRVHGARGRVVGGADQGAARRRALGGREADRAPLHPDSETDYQGLQFIPYPLYKDPVFKRFRPQPGPARPRHLPAGQALRVGEPRVPPEGARADPDCCCTATRPTGSPSRSRPPRRWRTVTTPSPTTPRRTGRSPSCPAAIAIFASRPGPRPARGPEPQPGGHRRGGPGRLGGDLAWRDLARLVPAQGARVPDQSVELLLSPAPAGPGGLPTSRARRLSRRRGRRLARLLGVDLAYGWTDDGLTRPLAPQHSWHA